MPETFFETAGMDADVKTVGGTSVPTPACPEGEVCQAVKAVRATDGTKSPVAVLSDDQARCLMECVQADRRASIVTRPKVIVADMQTGYIQVGKTARFLTKLELTAGPNGLECKPQYQTVQLGTTIRATPKVSADRRFVELRLNYRTAQPSAVASATAVKVGEEATAEVLAAPSIAVQMIDTTLAIPAGKTVLLAGPVETREERTECGSPVLSKVPHMNKLFDSRFIISECAGRVKYRHLLLVTAKVVSPQSDCCAASACKVASPAADCKACPATCETVAVAKPARPADTEASRLVAAYHKACADGRSEDALRLAMQALSRDPNCFADQK